MHWLYRSRRFMRRVVIGAAEKLGSMRSFVPFRGAVKRVLGIHPAAPRPRETTRNARLAAFSEARALNGGINEAGLEWLISRAPRMQRALNYVDGASGRQIETALALMGVPVSSDQTELVHALATHAVVFFKSSDARLASARRRFDRVADIVVIDDEAGDGSLRFGGMNVLPAPTSHSVEAA